MSKGKKRAAASERAERIYQAHQVESPHTQIVSWKPQKDAPKSSLLPQLTLMGVAKKDAPSSTPA